MRIISWNINGLGRHFSELQELVAKYQPDFVCLQKVRAKYVRAKYEIPGYKQSWDLQDCGDWSGVMLYWKPTSHPGLTLHPETPKRISTPTLSDDGHLMLYETPSFYLVNAYAPFSNKELDGASDLRKRWDNLLRMTVASVLMDKPVVLMGDMNIVHRSIDSSHDRFDKNEPCYYAWERDDFNALLSEGNLVDTYRKLHPEEQGFSYYSDSLFRDIHAGDRIDYALVSESILPLVKQSDILDFGTSNSLPLILDIDLGVTDRPSRSRKSSQGLDQRASIANAVQTISVKDAAKWLARLAASGRQGTCRCGQFCR